MEHTPEEHLQEGFAEPQVPPPNFLPKVLASASVMRLSLGKGAEGNRHETRGPKLTLWGDPGKGNRRLRNDSLIPGAYFFP
jgi:hypothetical protein